MAVCRFGRRLRLVINRVAASWWCARWSAGRHPDIVPASGERSCLKVVRVFFSGVIHRSRPDPRAGFGRSLKSHGSGYRRFSTPHGSGRVALTRPDPTRPDPSREVSGLTREEPFAFFLTDFVLSFFFFWDEKAADKKVLTYCCTKVLVQEVYESAKEQKCAVGLLCWYNNKNKKKVDASFFFLSSLKLTLQRLCFIRTRRTFFRTGWGERGGKSFFVCFLLFL